MTFLALTSVVLAQEAGGGDSGELHCNVGEIGIILVVLSFVAGFLCSGRFGRIKGLKQIPLHYGTTLIMNVYLTGEFVLGFTKLNFFFLLNFHGVLGVSIPVLAWLTFILSPCVAKKLIKRKPSSKIHTVLALLLLFLVIIQVVYAYFTME